MRGPAKRPCSTCPYRKDAPSGLWDATEYEKLPEFDKPTVEQPPKIFLCHKAGEHLCAGWCGTHDLSQSPGLMIAYFSGRISESDTEAAVNYVSPIPLFASGAEAAAHGMRDIDNPSAETQRVADQMGKYVERNCARLGIPVPGSNDEGDAHASDPVESPAMRGPVRVPGSAAGRGRRARH